MITSINNSVLMSIRPKYADLIFSGEKTHELRRKVPNVSSGDVIVVYSSSPEKRMKGTGYISF
jgi:predicted transcriptional regulator